MKEQSTNKKESKEKKESNGEWNLEIYLKKMKDPRKGKPEGME